MKVILYGNPDNPNRVEMYGHFKGSPNRVVVIEIKDAAGDSLGVAEVRQDELKAAAEIL